MSLFTGWWKVPLVLFITFSPFILYWMFDKKKEAKG